MRICVQESYLWVYVDLLHIPDLQFSASIGPALILNIVAALGCLAVASISIRMASQRRAKFREAIALELADWLDVSRRETGRSGVTAP
jgi:hypothetical protein